MKMLDLQRRIRAEEARMLEEVRLAAEMSDATGDDPVTKLTELVRRQFGLPPEVDMDDPGEYRALYWYLRPLRLGRLEQAYIGGFSMFPRPAQRP